MTGRVAIIKLLPLTIQESKETDPYTLMYKGGYPILYVNGEIPRSFFPAYIQNYLEREVKTVHGIEDLRTFRKFMEICAYLAGNFFDYDTVCRTLDVKKKTVDKWLTVLYSSYIIFFASPYYKSTMAKFSNKDKLYFYDTGLCTSLMSKAKSPEHIQENPILRGQLFENLVFSEIWKKNFIHGEYLDPAYFWNIKGEGGYEVDMIMEGVKNLKAIEIKSSNKFDPHWFDNMQKHPDLQAAEKFVVYTGPTQDVEGGRALNFCDLDQLFLR
jgi:predicted AAA+ superfamily ATPase